MMEKLPVSEGEELELKIECIGEKGDGIAKVNGYTIFVKDAKVVNETLKVKISKALPALPRFAFADIIN